LRGESEGAIVDQDQGQNIVTGSGLQLAEMDYRCAESTPGTVPCSVSKITMFVQQSPLARGAKEGLKTFMPGTSSRPSARRRAFAWSCSITCAARGFTFQEKVGMMRRVGYGTVRNVQRKRREGAREQGRRRKGGAKSHLPVSLKPVQPGSSHSPCLPATAPQKLAHPSCARHKLCAPRHNAAHRCPHSLANVQTRKIISKNDTHAAVRLEAGKIGVGGGNADLRHTLTLVAPSVRSDGGTSSATAALRRRAPSMWRCRPCALHMSATSLV
jgi:hypothetical protein